MKTVLITGAEGFAGTHLVRHLRDQGYQVVAGVRNRARKLSYERNGISALVCDVADPINVARVVASAHPDGIVHLASVSRPAHAKAEPLEAYQTIVTAWANLLDAVRRTVPRARVVLVSAADVYGDSGGNGQPKLHESTELNPVTTFGSLKKTAESIAHTFYRDYHLNLSIARPFQYTGPGQPERFFLGALAQRLAGWNSVNDGTSLAWPDLDCVRDWLHVEDVAAAYATILQQGRPDQAYNVCSGVENTCSDVASRLVSAFGHDITLRDLPSDEADVQIRRLCGDNTKLRDELGWQPTRTLDEAIDELAASWNSARREVAGVRG